jgi:hypothetical protein
MKKILQSVRSFFLFYYDGFRTMPSWGRRVWLIILVKLFIMFAVLKLFFFPDFLGSRFKTDEEKSDYVIEQLVNKPNTND